MKRERYILILVCALLIPSVSRAADPPQLQLYNGRTLAQVKQLAEEKDPSFREPVRKLQRDADKALGADLLTVTDKKLPAPSGDPHDYVSMARYWWPNPDTKDGLPYIRKDGEVNEEILKYTDHENLQTMVKTVTTLSLAYYFFEKEKYAEKAVEMIRTWFIDTATAMNPNLDYSQFVPGRNVGRGSGVLDGREFSLLPDMVSLLRPSSSWTADDEAALKRWFTRYLDWLRTSKNGVKESEAKNNHGTWYDVQTASIAIFLGKTDFAKELIQTASDRRIAQAIQPTGEQPEELVRTKSLDYSLFNLEALMRLAGLGESVGIDLWRYRAPNGASIKRAVDYLVPFVSGEQRWERQQIVPVKEQTIFLVLAQAYVHYGDERYAKAMTSLKDIDRTKERTIVLYGVRLP